MDHVLLFLAGVSLINALPHLVKGLCGEPFPTPFARPRGVGDSPPLTNFLWGFVNLALGIGLTLNRLPHVDRDVGLALLAAGGLTIGVYLALHFGKVRGARH